MNIIHRILTTKPFSLPPVERDAEGFHHLNIDYRTESFTSSNYSLNELLHEYLEFVIAVEKDYEAEQQATED